jgi:hypothetical protein
MDSESVTSKTNDNIENIGSEEHCVDPMDVDDDENWIDNDTEEEDDPLPRQVRKTIHSRSKYGTEKRLVEKMNKARVNFYKEKGAADMAYLRRHGKNKIPDVTLALYPQRRVSRIDIEDSMSSCLKMISEDISDISDRMSEIFQLPGVQFESVTNVMKDLERTLSNMCLSNADIRRVTTTRQVHLDSYLPMKSKGDLEIFFKVTFLGSRHLTYNIYKSAFSTFLHLQHDDLFKDRMAATKIYLESYANYDTTIKHAESIIRLLVNANFRSLFLWVKEELKNRRNNMDYTVIESVPIEFRVFILDHMNDLAKIFNIKRMEKSREERPPKFDQNQWLHKVRSMFGVSNGHAYRKQVMVDELGQNYGWKEENEAYGNIDQ